MKHLARPTDKSAQLLLAGEVFETCVSKVRNPALKAKLRAARPKVESEAADYADKAKQGRLYTKLKHGAVGAASADEMVSVYTSRMVPKSASGRAVYDHIMSLPAHGRCPFCGIGTVNTLDHYLPKQDFPVFSVSPDNLVPACTWCQGEKMEYHSSTEGGQILHPYFDDFDDDIWLSAEVIESAPAAFRFFAMPPDHWTQPRKERGAAHLRELGLHRLFSSNAGSRLSEIRARLTGLFQKGGATEVRAHLHEELTSLEADQKNSWTAAMYRAAIGSDWFCQGGFLQS